MSSAKKLLYFPLCSLYPKELWGGSLSCPLKIPLARDLLFCHFQLKTQSRSADSKLQSNLTVRGSGPRPRQASTQGPRVKRACGLLPNFCQELLQDPSVTLVLQCPVLFSDLRHLLLPLPAPGSSHRGLLLQLFLYLVTWDLERLPARWPKTGCCLQCPPGSSSRASSGSNSHCPATTLIPCSLIGEAQRIDWLKVECCFCPRAQR